MNILSKLLITSSLIASCIACSTPEQKDVLSIEGGLIKGVPSVAEGVTVFKGVPYAAAPVGELRWKRPQPVTPWDTVMVADHWGYASVQRGRTPDSFYYKEFQLTGPFVTSEDCLYLNVWAPTSTLNDKDAKLPVAMWIHGGAYLGGAGHDDAFDGDAWANKGVILVTINYRLGILGFLSHALLSEEETDGCSGNYGLYDQLAALQWVHNNIEQFGGDPSNITVFGQSAGAGSVKNLISSPLAIPMINRAIIQSGGGLGTFIPTENKQASLDALAKELSDKEGISTTKQMRELSADKANEIFMGVGLTLASPHNDATIIPEDFNAAAYNDHLANIEIMIGSNGDDMGDMREQITEFGKLQDSLGNKPVYTYYFDRKLPGDDSGAFHSAELWYTFNTLGRSWRPFTDGDYALSEKMVTFWTNFAKFGNPNGKDVDGEWKPCTNADPYMQLFNVE